jgi:hypothetical protein
VEGDKHIKGLAELQSFLDQVAPKVERNIMRGALRAGIKLMKDEAVLNCPVGLPSSEGRRLYGGYEGALRDSIRIGTNAKGGRVTARVIAGGKTYHGVDVFYTHIIEGFWKTHTATPYPIAAFGKGKSLFFGGVFAKHVMHPPIVAHPFLRPALDREAQSAVIAAAEYMKKRLATKEGMDTAHIMIEGDE